MKFGTAIVQLAHYGDIINILPLVKIIADQDGKIPTLIVPESHRSLLDGISYATFGTVNTKKLMFQGLMKTLERRYDRVIVPQVSMKGLSYERRCASFTMEAWDRAGMLSYWEAGSLQFDQRDMVSEGTLVEHHIREEPNILVNLSGISSPFPDAEFVWKDLRFRWGHKCNLINMGSFKAKKFQDLLGLMDSADALITIDTGTLHLAAASRVPMFAFIADRPSLWHGSIPLRKPDVSMRYKEALIRLEELHSWISARLGTGSIAHVFSEYPAKGDPEKKRRVIAQSSWKQLYVGGLYPRPVLDVQLPRLFHDGKRDLPYVKDIINLGFLSWHGGILLTNTDTCFSPKLVHEHKKLIHQPAWFRRRDFNQINKVLDQVDVESGEDYCGTDMFFIPREWWKKFQHRYPDLLIGTEGWDCCLRELMRVNGGTEIVDCCYHERHDSIWERPENRYTLSSQKYNIALSKKFLKGLGLDPRNYGFI